MAAQPRSPNSRLRARTLDETALATYRERAAQWPREIEQLKVIESYPEGIFDEAATQGINQWQFEPAMYQGQAVRAWAKQRIRFDLS